MKGLGIIARAAAAFAAAASLGAFAQLGAHATRYAGMLPCGDCAAIRFELTLYTELGKPSRYEQRFTYVDSRGGDRSVGNDGRWSLVKGSATDPQAPVVELVGMGLGQRDYFLVVGERALHVLDAHRREIDSPWPQVLWRAEREFTGDPVVVSDAQAGAALELNPGEELVVRLGSNHTTGYRWTPRLASEPPVVALLATPTYEARGGPPGAGGVEVWRFSAFTHGTQTLTFDYGRGFEPHVPPAHVVSFTVTVR